MKAKTFTTKITPVLFWEPEMDILLLWISYRNIYLITFILLIEFNSTLSLQLSLYIFLFDITTESETNENSPKQKYRKSNLFVFSFLLWYSLISWFHNFFRRRAFYQIFFFLKSTTMFLFPSRFNLRQKCSFSSP